MGGAKEGLGLKGRDDPVSRSGLSKSGDALSGSSGGWVGARRKPGGAFRHLAAVV